MRHSHGDFAGLRYYRSPAAKGNKPWGFRRRLAIELLESRNLLAAVDVVAGDLVITDSTGTTNDALTIVSDAVNQRFEISDPGNLITTTIPNATGSGTNTVQVPFAAVTGSQALVNTLGGTDSVVIGGEFGVGVTIDGGDGTDTVNFNSDTSFAANRSLLAMAETINVGAGADIVTWGTGAITVTADNIEIDATATLVSDSTVTLKAQSAIRAISIGTEIFSASELSLTDSELDRITAGTVQIGHAAGGPIRVHNAITHANDLSLTSADEIRFIQSVTMAADKDFTATSTSTTQRIFFTTPDSDIVTSGTGTILLDAARSIQMVVPGSSLSTENGGITLLGNQAGTAATSAPAIEAVNATITSTGTGNILIDGRGFGASAGHDAVRVGDVQSLSTANAPTQGTITIIGTDGLLGVRQEGTITSNSGNITIIGHGGNVGTAHEVYGVRIGGSVVAANGTSISITGIGGTSTSHADGIEVHGSLQSQDGSITLKGTGGQEGSATGNGSRGVAITGSSNPRVTSTTGPILIEGVGGSSPSDDYGVEILATGASAAVAAGGPLSIKATGGTGGNSFGVVINATQTQLAISGSSSLHVTTDSIARGIRGQIDMAGGVTFVPMTPGLPITIGDTDVLTGTQRLGLSNTELFGIYAPTIVIGDATSGNVTVDAAIAPDTNRSRNMELISGGDIIFNANLSTVGFFNPGPPPTGSLLLSPGSNGGVQPLASSTDVTTRFGTTQFPTSFAPDSDLEISIEGTTVDTQYNQLRAIGAVHLTGADLALSGSFVSTLGDVFTIVSANSVSGQFNNLPENCSFVHNGRSLRVNYTATTVTLTDVGQPPTIDVDIAAVSTGEGSAVTNTGTFNDPDGNATATVTASIGTVTQDNALGTWSWSLPTTDGPQGPFDVTITVTDFWCAHDDVTFEYSVDNLPPTADDATFAIDENESAGTLVGTVAAIDPGPDDELSYEVIGGTGQTAFTDDAMTGEISVADPIQLDFETTPSFSLDVRVSDNDGLSDVAVITINLNDLVEAPPTGDAELFGLVWEDFNNDGEVNFGEKAIAGVTIHLSGVDELGQIVSQTQPTDADGFYLFFDLRPGVYTISEGQPSGFDDGQDILGTVDGASAGVLSANDVFSEIVLGQGSVAENYNFGERPAADGGVVVGQTATIGYWQNTNGQALLESLNGGGEVTQLSSWLAMSLPNMYGAGAGANDLTGFDNTKVADFYTALFRRKKKEALQLGLGGPVKTDAQVMAVAFASYVTNETLAGTVAAEYGFLITEHGVGTRTFNVADGGEAFDVVDNTELTVLDLLFATNRHSFNGRLYDEDGDGDADDEWETILRTLANDVYSAINEQGDIL